ncbi:MAG: type II toxin-antitoxin system VapC family toxin [Pseudolabrys sp.]
MIVLDTSVIIAVLFEEPDALAFVDKIKSADACSSSAATLFEVGIVLARQAGSTDDGAIQEFLASGSVQVIPFDAVQSAIARETYRRFGQGSGHPARLNFGDCFAYALANALDAPLLFKGDDFGHTDVRAA